MRLIHITDLHLQDPALSKFNAQRAVFLADCLQKLAHNYAEATCCVITGDLAHDGEPSAYQWLHEQLDKLPFPTILLMGNHDDREVFSREFGPQALSQTGFIQGIMDTSEARLVFLDTLDSSSNAGTLCEERMEWLRSTLEQSSDTPILLFMHHPPFKVGDPKMDPIRLDNGDALARVLKETDCVRHIFFGHTHRNIFVNWHGIPSTSLKALQPINEDVQAKFSLAFGIVDLVGEELIETTLSME